MKTSDQINEIATALAMAQGEMEAASKSTVNPFFKSKYSSLSQIWEVAKAPLKNHKLVLVQDLGSTEKGILVTTRICHASGQWMEFGPLEIPSSKKDAQGLGSAASYGRRYALAAALSIVSDEDDDGNAACQPTAKKEKPEEQPLEPIQYVSVDKAKEWFEKVGKDAEYVKRILDLYKVAKFTEIPASNIQAIDRSITSKLAKAAENK